MKLRVGDVLLDGGVKCAVVSEVTRDGRASVVWLDKYGIPLAPKEPLPQFFPTAGLTHHLQLLIAARCTAGKALYGE